MVVNPSPLTGNAGFIGIAEKGYVTLEITALGEGGHSSTPPRNSAAVRLARAVVALDQNQMPSSLSKPFGLRHVSRRRQGYAVHAADGVFESLALQRHDR